MYLHDDISREMTSQKMEEFFSIFKKRIVRAHLNLDLFGIIYVGVAGDMGIWNTLLEWRHGNKCRVNCSLSVNQRGWKDRVDKEDRLHASDKHQQWLIIIMIIIHCW